MRDYDKLVIDIQLLGMPSMRKYIEIYALIVCFVAVIWFAVTLTSFLNEIIRATYPQITMSENPPQPVQIASTNSKVTLSPNIAAQNQKLAYEQNLAKERQRGILESIRRSIDLLVSALVFFFHWRLFKKSSAVG